MTFNNLEQIRRASVFICAYKENIDVLRRPGSNLLSIEMASSLLGADEMKRLEAVAERRVEEMLAELKDLPQLRRWLERCPELAAEWVVEDSEE